MEVTSFKISIKHVVTLLYSIKRRFKCMTFTINVQTVDRSVDSYFVITHSTVLGGGKTHFTSVSVRMEKTAISILDD